MLTECAPKNPALRAGFLQSDLLASLPVPADNRLQDLAKPIAAALETGTPTGLQPVCAEFLRIAADFYGVEKPGIRVLAARPIRVREGGWASELFGDYSPESLQIRVWMRTAVRKEVTSIGTFLSTLCHEFCHHLDYQRFKFNDSWHTRGFYERTAVLYHHARGTPAKRLFWMRMRGGQWRIDWPRTRRGVVRYPTGEAMEDEEPIRIPITDVFDLHTVHPKEVVAVVEAYLEEANRLGLKSVRIIHGRGIGVQRQAVRAVLARTTFVIAFSDAPPEAAGWGATVVKLQ